MQGQGPPTFPSAEAKRAFEREEAAREEVHPLDWADDFGPLKYTELTRFVMHMQRIERARDDAAEEHALAVAAGYIDASHFRRVRATFLKYWGAPNGSDVLREFTWKEPEFSRAILGATQLEREEGAQAALRKDPALFAPQAYTAAGAGQIGAASSATPSGNEPPGHEPMSLERYAEIGVAVAAWTRQGKDVHAMMMQVFQIDAAELSNVGMYWHQRFTADVTLLGRHGRLQDELKAKYEEPDPDADLVY